MLNNGKRGLDYMKKVVLMFITAIVMMCSFSSCGFLFFNWEGASSSESSVEDIKGSSPDNPIPLGEYGQIGREVANGQQDVRMKIIEVLTPEEANKRWNVDIVCYIVLIQIDVVDLSGGGYHYTNDNFLLKNGQTDPGRLIVDFDDVEWSGSVTFGGEGSVECYAAYEGNFDEVKCFVYYKNVFYDPIYFALQ